MELDVEQTKEGVEVKGTLDEQTVSATGSRQEDGSLRVEVKKDEKTMLDMTINPEAMRDLQSTPPQEKKP